MNSQYFKFSRRAWKMVVFLDVGPCSLADTGRRFSGYYYFVSGEMSPYYDGSKHAWNVYTVLTNCIEELLLNMVMIRGEFFGQLIDCVLRKTTLVCGCSVVFVDGLRFVICIKSSVGTGFALSPLLWT
jgi:hypothetical protein